MRDELHVETSEAYAISLTTGGDRWQSGEERTSQDGTTISEATFDLAPRFLLQGHRRG